MTPATIGSNNDKLDLLIGGLGEIKQMISQIDARVRTLENTTITQGVTSSQEQKAAFRKLDEHTAQFTRMESHIESSDKCIEEHDKRIERMEGVITFVRWVGAAFGALIVALMWAILTHTVTLTYMVKP